MGYYADIYAEAEQLQQLTVDGIEIFVYSIVDGQVKVIYLLDDFRVNLLINNLSVYEVVEIVKNF